MPVSGNPEEEIKIKALLEIARLLKKSLDGGLLTIEEQGIVNQWIDQHKENRRLYDEINVGGFKEIVLGELDELDETAISLAFRRVYEATGIENSGHPSDINPILEEESLNSIGRNFFDGLRKWWAAAAILVLAIGAGYLVFQKKSERPGNQPVAATRKAILPGHNGAVLHLGNGAVIALDSAGNGTIALQSGVEILKEGGQIQYKGKSKSITYNDISTNNGMQWKMVLPDGTKVWLNAASSLHYPVYFNDSDRIVTLSGEAYFEVAHDPKRPFHVQVGNMDVRVLGTHFNVNAYPDEKVVRTTLLEGAVQVRQGNYSKRIIPGWQAVSSREMPGIDAKAVDVEQAVAWKNGFFQFKQTDIHELMRQISRWYDLEISYASKTSNDLFSGTIPRSVPLTELLTLLRKSNIHFKLEGNTLTVLP